MNGVRLLAWLAAAALIAVTLAGTLRAELLSPAEAVVSAVATLVAVTVGVAVWARRPESRIGVLLAAAPVATVLSGWVNVFPRSALAVTVGFAAIRLAAAIAAHAFLSYPTGRLTSRLDRAFIALGYCYVLAYAVPLLLFHDPRAPTDPDVFVQPRYAVPLTHVAWRDVTGVWDAFDVGLIVLTVGFAVLLVRKLIRAIPGARRVLLPLAIAGLLAAVQFAVQIGLWAAGSPASPWTSPTMFWTETIAGLGVPVALGAGLLWGRSARAAVADLVVELERSPAGSVRDALARTLGDPSLRLALWLPAREAYVDADGRPVQLPRPGPEQAVTVLGPADAPVAALIHDPALLEQRAFLDAAGAAARFALENERLRAELRLQLEEVRSSRARIVQAGDEERRRLERDLHDGAQQRLLGLGLALQLARAQAERDADGTLELLAEAETELRAALDELRELARGIHPAILAHQGLAAALRSLAERSTVPVTLRAVPEGRLDERVEVAAYFLVSEALANVAKYARASRAVVSVTRADGLAVVEVEDDGVGGADPARGTGLSGLLDRIQALDGSLSVESPAGRGTRIHAEIPCAS